jgi:transporter family-2 protein
MTQVLYILLAVSAGLGSALQTGLISSLSRARGPLEASLISALVSVCGLTVVLGYKAAANHGQRFVAPLDHPAAYVIALVVGAGYLYLAMRGVDSYLATAGLFGFFYLFSAAVVAPRIGIALFAAAITAGTMIGSVALDHYGAFGGATQRIDAYRVIGVIALMAGVFLIRGR